MYRMKIASLFLFAYCLLCPIFGIGLTRTESGHLVLANWYLVGFDLGIVSLVITGFYTLYRYMEAEEKVIDYAQAEGFNEEVPSKKKKMVHA